MQERPRMSDWLIVELLLVHSLWVRFWCIYSWILSVWWNCCIIDHYCRHIGSFFFGQHELQCIRRFFNNLTGLFEDLPSKIRLVGKVVTVSFPMSWGSCQQRKCIYIYCIYTFKLYGCFLKWGYPKFQIIHFILGLPTKKTIRLLGYPHDLGTFVAGYLCPTPQGDERKMGPGYNLPWWKYMVYQLYIYTYMWIFEFNLKMEYPATKWSCCFLRGDDDNQTRPLQSQRNGWPWHFWLKALFWGCS